MMKFWQTVLIVLFVTSFTSLSKAEEISNHTMAEKNDTVIVVGKKNPVGKGDVPKVNYLALCLSLLLLLFLLASLCLINYACAKRQRRRQDTINRTKELRRMFSEGQRSSLFNTPIGSSIASHVCAKHFAHGKPRTASRNFINSLRMLASTSAANDTGIAMIDAEDNQTHDEI